MPFHGHAAPAAGKPLEPHAFEPAPLGPHDVEIAVTHCGICHSDVHLVDDDWRISRYPLVPGHEVIGTVTALGVLATHLSPGQRVGVGWQSGSCMTCEWCVAGEETSCPRQAATCVGRPGGFADSIRVDARFAFAIPEGLSSETAAPLLCAGATMYTPLSELARPASRVGVIGIGGLGHLGLQLAAAMGCEVTALSTTPDKEAEARAFGAHRFVVTKDAGAMKKAVRSLDLLLSTATSALDWNAFLRLLRPKGTLVFLGAPGGGLDIAPSALLGGRYGVRGSVIGTRAGIAEMLSFAARHGIAARTELFPMADADRALQHVRQGKARYRAVLVA